MNKGGKFMRRRILISNFTLIFLISLMVTTLSGAAFAQDVVVQELQAEVDVTKSKAENNEGKIENMGKNFLILQDQIDNIQLIPGPPGADGHSPLIEIGANGNWFVDGLDTGVSATGPAGQDGGSSGPCGGGSPEVDSFFESILGGTEDAVLAVLDPGEEFIVTDVAVRVFNPLSTPVPDRFTLRSGGVIIFDMGTSPSGVLQPQEGFQEGFHFESGLRIPPGSDILFHKEHNNGFVASVTISGYSCGAGIAKVDSFYGMADSNVENELIAQLEPGQGFVITDVAARAYHPNSYAYDVLDRFNLISGGEALFEAAASGDGWLSPGERKQTFVSFKSGLRVPPGGDILLHKLRDTEFLLEVTVSGYYY
jgi:hypothetical protein